MSKQLIAERDHFKEECAELTERRDFLLKLVSDLSRNAISADEAAESHSQIRALIAEVGTLRAQLVAARQYWPRCSNCGADLGLACHSCGAA